MSKAVELHYCGTERFARTRSDAAWIEFEQSPPRKSWLTIAGQFSVGIILGLAVLMVVL